MFKMKRALPEEPRQDAPAELQGSEIDNHDPTIQARPAGPRADGLKSRVPPALTPKRRQSAAPDGATIRQQFEAVRRYAAEPSVGLSRQPGQAPAEEPSRLLIGRDISFKGQIADCQSLIVEGKVAANAKCRSLQIQESGVYKGEIEAETVEVCGRIEGRVQVRGRLTIRAAGRVNGEVTYGELDIAAGGQLSGEIRHEPVPQEVAKDERAAPAQPVVAATAEITPSVLSDPPVPLDPPDPSDVGPQVRPPTPVADEPSSTGELAPQQAEPAPQQAEPTPQQADPAPEPNLKNPFAVGAAGDRP